MEVNTSHPLASLTVITGYLNAKFAIISDLRDMTETLHATPETAESCLAYPLYEILEQSGANDGDDAYVLINDTFTPTLDVSKPTDVLSTPDLAQHIKSDLPNMSLDFSSFTLPAGNLVPPMVEWIGLLRLENADHADLVPAHRSLTDGCSHIQTYERRASQRLVYFERFLRDLLFSSKVLDLEFLERHRGMQSKSYSLLSRVMPLSPHGTRLSVQLISTCHTHLRQRPTHGAAGAGKIEFTRPLKRYLENMTFIVKYDQETHIPAVVDDNDSVDDDDDGDDDDDDDAATERSF
ncbi:hypothetical protein ACJ72_03317 [Emergomyces africanus]|uniref:Uncharacterized protein n=1 Tax=Emergomyces africanus TaxID=1955775 RepID=A0A1B7NZY9_9EURO|nr:hypothetical protein ACJ72_03317 [Emergomyces africanus]